MKVERVMKSTTFSELKAGDKFEEQLTRADNAVFVKIDEVHDGVGKAMNAYCINKNYFFCYSPSSSVAKIDVKMVILE